MSIEDVAGTATRLSELEAQVVDLRRLEAARTLIHDYAKACDADDAATVASLFTEDGELWAGPRRFEGRDAIGGFYRDALGTPTCHVVGVARLAVGADGLVDAHATFLAVELAPGDPKLRWGTYADRIEVDGSAAGKARFTSRRITLDGSAAL